MPGPAIARRMPTADSVVVLASDAPVPIPRGRGAAGAPGDAPQGVEHPVVPRAEVRCFVVDGSPAYRSGLRAALMEADLVAEELEDATSLREQVAEGGVALLHAVALVHAMESASVQPPWVPLDVGVVVTVGLLPGDAAADYAEALRRGWDAVVFRDAPLPEIVVVVREAIENRTVLPTAVAHDFAARVKEDLHGLSPEQVEWVQFLTGGGTIAALAQKLAFSEREMHRRLNVVYRRLGAANKVEALLEARKRGLA